LIIYLCLTSPSVALGLSATAATLSPNNPSFIYLFKHQQQRAQATYMPEKSSTFMHVKQ